MTLYHPKIGFPSSFRRPVGTFKLLPGRHAQARATQKGFVIPESINLNDFSIVEIEMIDGKLVKIVVRGEYDEYDDICMAIMPKGGIMFVKTAWLNHWQDKHETLDTTRYGRP